MRGGGLIRSAGGLAAIISRSPEDRELWVERILESGDFVESVLRNGEKSGDSGKPSIEDVLKDLTEESGISREQILGANRNRRVSSARRQFYISATERAGATLAVLGRLTGRSHVAVRLAIEQAKSERNGKADDE